MLIYVKYLEQCLVCRKYYVSSLVVALNRGIERGGEGQGWAKRLERNVAMCYEYQKSFPEGYKKFYLV